MKYGQNFEQESVPRWSLHNVDYNALKHQIKAHTTKDQARAIAIPGHVDANLKRFEDDLYFELIRQHERVDLFVTSKADEIGRRLRYLSDQTQRLMVQWAQSNRSRLSLKKQRKLAKYEEEAVLCAQDTADLERFVNAQRTAFRKILKKYKKWTGSTTLDTRFKETILGNPKSFTRRDFGYLKVGCEEMLTTIRSASLDPTVKRADGDAAAPEARSNRQRRREFVRSNTGGTGAAASSGSQTAGELPPSQIHYWNEYDDGSDGGGGGAANDDGEYAIYIQPGTESSFPVLDHMVAVITAPAHKLGAWLRHHRLLPTDHGQPSSPSQSPVLSTTVGGGSTERSPLLSGGGGGGGGCGPGPATTAGGATYFTLPHPATGGSASGGRTNHKARTATTSDETESVASSGSSPIHPYYPHTSYSNSYYHTAGPSTSGYRTLVAAPASAALLPSVPHQRLALLHRERLLRRVTWAALACSGSLCAVAVVLVTTGRHRQRLEVDAGATIGVVASLCCAAAGLGCMIARRQRTVPTTTIGGELWSGVNGGDLMTGVGMWERLATWTAFVACCIVNGAVLVLVAENS